MVSVVSILDTSPSISSLYDIKWYDVDNEESDYELMAISSAKATGCDGIPIKFLKCNLNLSSQILTHIINLSLGCRIVPEGWKTAEVVPLFKSGDKGKAENYRPISILPSASKILERVVHTQVYGFLQQHSLFSNAQFGFRKNHSTSSCILYLTDIIYKSIDIGNFTGVVFLDLKKAFDTVDHDILLKKLYKYSFGRESIDWFRNYVMNRKQLVKVNGVKSDVKDMVCGVPQGSILGPLLFILYIKDMVEYLVESRINLYADDTALYYSANDIENVMNVLSREMMCVGEWLRANKLTLNISKTKFIIFGSPHRLRNLPDIKLQLYGKEIERVDCMKYLGVLLDSSLSFEQHIDYLSDKASQKLGAIRKVRDLLDVSTTLTLYKSLVLPHFDYCDTVYMTSSLKNLNKLQLIQNSACRTILLANRYTSVVDMHNELKLTTLYIRRNLHMASECHRHIYFEGRASLGHFYVPVLRHDTVQTRAEQSNRMFVPRTRTVAGDKAMSVRGPRFWNSLRDDLRAVSCNNLFKCRISESAHAMFENYPT